MADVFLSYKREDRSHAREIAEAIQRHGFTVFFDVEIEVGESFDERIEREIAAARCVVVLWSPRSTAAKWVRREARFGSERDHLAPAIIAPCDIPLEFSDMQAANLSSWRGDPSDEQWRDFIARITECVQKPAKALPPQPWRRRGPQTAAISLLVLAVLGAGAYGAYRYWPMLSHSGGKQVATTPATTTPTTPTSAAELPGSVERLLQASILAGDCDGLAADMISFRTTLPQMASYERGYLTECRRHASEAQSPPPVKVAQATPPPKPAPTSASAAPGASAPSAATSAGPAPTTAKPADSAAPAKPVASTDTVAFLKSLVRAEPKALDKSEIERVASQLGVEPAALAAAVNVEGAAGGFAADGRPSILFEPHIFSRLTAHRFDADHAAVSYVSWGAKPYPGTQAGRWAQLEEAAALDPGAALQATSWGRFQILGLNYKRAGFDTAEAFASAQAQSEAGQLDAFANFLASNGLVEKLKTKDWAGFTRIYNGPGQVDLYSKKLNAAYLNNGVPS